MALLCLLCLLRASQERRTAMEAVLSVREAYMGVLEDGKVGGWAACVGGWALWLRSAVGSMLGGWKDSKL
jgi:hypothetical protein